MIVLFCRRPFSMQWQNNLILKPCISKINVFSTYGCISYICKTTWWIIFAIIIFPMFQCFLFCFFLVITLSWLSVIILINISESRQILRFTLTARLFYTPQMYQVTIRNTITRAGNPLPERISFHVKNPICIVDLVFWMSEKIFIRYQQVFYFPTWFLNQRWETNDHKTKCPRSIVTEY